MIDTHSHIYLEQFDDDRAEAIARAKMVGIERIILPNIDSESIDRLYQTEKDFAGFCYAAMGLHPTSVNASYQDELSVVEKQLKERSYVAIGEIGIDLYWDKTYLTEQIIAFEQQLEWALQYNYPVIIHSRDSHNEIMASLKKFASRNLTGVFHSFGGTIKQAQEILNFGGFKLGINGVVTFKNSGLDNVLAQLNPEDLVLETDSPYLAPIPFRGQRNETAYLSLIKNKLAEIFNISEAEIDKITTQNTKTIFPSVFKIGVKIKK